MAQPLEKILGASMLELEGGDEGVRETNGAGIPRQPFGLELMKKTC